MKIPWLMLSAGLWCAAQAQTDGKALFERVCTKCHKLDATVKQHNTRDRWSEVVDDMVARGAEASDADLEKIVEYLARNYGPKVAVNKAAASELSAGLEISPANAEAIVEYRKKNGSFKSLEELKKVPSLDAAGLERLKDRLDFSEPK